MRYASGKYARAICDRCGFEIPYLKLQKEWTGLRVCRSCLDYKTKQDFPDPVEPDPEALMNPRPDVDVEAGLGVIRADSSGMLNEDLVGKKFSSDAITITLGSVTVSTS